MNEVERTLHRTRKTLMEACIEAGVEFDPGLVTNIQECSNCSIWHKISELIPDLDNNPICKNCKHFYGL